MLLAWLRRSVLSRASRCCRRTCPCWSARCRGRRTWAVITMRTCPVSGAVMRVAPRCPGAARSLSPIPAARAMQEWLALASRVMSGDPAGPSD